MSATELPRHIVDRFERRWAKKLEQQASLEKRKGRVALAYQSRRPRHSTDAALAAATEINLRGSVRFADTTA